MAMTQRDSPARPNSSDGNGRKQRGARSWRWLYAPACIVVVAAATYALFHFVILTRIPHAMLGKWLVVGGEMNGATLEFHRDGSMIGIANMEGKAGKIKAKVEVDGDTIRFTSTNPLTLKAETDTQTVRTLTEDQFVIEDRKGTVLRMQRLHE